jgi:hypothetical protein
MHAQVTIVKPNAINSLKDYNVLILYQPTAVFKAVLTNKSAGISTLLLLEPLLISFLNQQQSSLV